MILKYQLPHGMKNLNYLMDHILYEISEIILSISSKKKKKNETQNDNPPIRIYVNKIGNGVTFKIKTEHYLQLFMLETMKLPGSTKVKTLKMKMVKIYLI